MLLQPPFVDKRLLAQIAGQEFSSVGSHVIGEAAFLRETALTQCALEGVDSSVDGIDVPPQAVGRIELLAADVADVIAAIFVRQLAQAIVGVLKIFSGLISHFKGLREVLLHRMNIRV